MAKREPTREPEEGALAAPSTDPPTPRGPRLAPIVGWASGALVGLGAALWSADVLAQEPRPYGLWALVAGAVGLLVAGVLSGASDAGAMQRLAGDPRLVEAPPREGRWRTGIVAGFCVVLALEALIPLTYYFGQDAFDERFAWRMFSAVRVYRCELTATETANGVEAPVALQEEIHVAWITTLRRNREAVMERYLEWRCEQEGVSSARLVNHCTSPEGNAVDPVVRSIDCSVGEIEREEAAP